MAEARPRAKKLGLSVHRHRREDGERGDPKKAAGWLRLGIKSMAHEASVRFAAIDNSAARGKGLLIKPTSNQPCEQHTAQYANLANLR